MALTKRVLTKWRKEALATNAELIANQHLSLSDRTSQIVINDRVLLMTQELLDQHLLKEAINEKG